MPSQLLPFLLEKVARSTRRTAALMMSCLPPAARGPPPPPTCAAWSPPAGRAPTRTAMAFQSLGGERGSFLPGPASACGLPPLPPPLPRHHLRSQPFLDLSHTGTMASTARARPLAWGSWTFSSTRWGEEGGGTQAPAWRGRSRECFITARAQRACSAWAPPAAPAAAPAPSHHTNPPPARAPHPSPTSRRTTAL